MQDYLKEFREKLNLKDKFDQALLLDTMLFIAEAEQRKRAITINQAVTKVTNNRG